MGIPRVPNRPTVPANGGKGLHAASNHLQRLGVYSYASVDGPPSEVAEALKSVVRMIVVSVLGIMTLAACGQPTQTSGTVTGLASPCIGPPFPGLNTHDFQYTVSIYQGSRKVSEQRLTGDAGSTYRFSVPPGRYQLRNPPGSMNVTVREGKTTHVNLFEPCG